MNVFAIHGWINEGYGLIQIYTEKIRISPTKLCRVCAVHLRNAFFCRKFNTLPPIALRNTWKLKINYFELNCLLRQPFPKDYTQRQTRFQTNALTLNWRLISPVLARLRHSLRDITACRNQKRKQLCACACVMSVQWRTRCLDFVVHNTCNAVVSDSVDTLTRRAVDSVSGAGRRNRSSQAVRGLFNRRVTPRARRRVHEWLACLIHAFLSFLLHVSSYSACA